MHFLVNLTDGRVLGVIDYVIMGLTLLFCAYCIFSIQKTIRKKERGQEDIINGTILLFICVEIAFFMGYVAYLLGILKSFPVHTPLDILSILSFSYVVSLLYYKVKNK